MRYISLTPNPRPTVPRRSLRVPPLTTAFLAPWLLSALAHAADPRVTIVAHADPDYLASRYDAAGNLRTETYFVLQGQHFPGLIRDRSLEKTTIHDVARVLAPELSKQQYLPAKDVAEADLMLVVHWGTTVRTRPDVEHYMKMQDDHAQTRDFNMEYTAAMVDESAPQDMERNADHALRYTEQLQSDYYSGAGAWTNVALDRTMEHLQRLSMAQLLGFDAELQHGLSPFVTTRMQTLRSMLDDERYFIVVMAYDFPHFRSSGMKDAKRLWACRLSVHSPGMNFRRASVQLSQAGADFFGTNNPLATIRRQSIRTGTVEIGEPTVVEW